MRNRFKKLSGLSDETRKKIAEVRNRTKKIRSFYLIAILLADFIVDLVNLALGLPEYISLSSQVFVSVFIFYCYSKILKTHTKQIVSIGTVTNSWYLQDTIFKSEKIASRKKKNVSNDGVNANDFPYDTSFEEHLYKN